MNNKSPLRYPGGKTRACKIIECELLKYVDLRSFNTIVSPFFGGGSFEFYIQNKYGLDIIANDKFGPLYTFWHNAKHNNEMLCNAITALRPANKEQFIDYRNGIMSVDDSLTCAAWYFVINRCSFSGATLSGGFSKQAAEKRFTESSIDRIKDLNLTRSEFHNEDFTTFLTKKYENSLLFLDPPYYLQKASKLYGKNGDMHESFDHEGLFKALDNTRNWVLCYNDCSYIRKLYTKYTIIAVDWSYGMNKTKKSSEILILCL